MGMMFGFAYQEGYRDGYRVAREAADREFAMLRAQIEALTKASADLLAMQTVVFVVPKDLVDENIFARGL